MLTWICGLPCRKASVALAGLVAQPARTRRVARARLELSAVTGFAILCSPCVIAIAEGVLLFIARDAFKQ